MFLKKIIKENKYYKRIQEKFNLLENEINSLIYENVDLHIQIQNLKKQKIKVFFVCHRPAVWGSLKTVYESMKNDDSFDVHIITVPNKKLIPSLGLNHEIYESEGAEDFWKGEDVLKGYDYDAKKWINLKALKPDYVFFQQPYNNCKPYDLQTAQIFRYSKICYVSYFTFLANKINDVVNDECNPADFLKNLSFYFTQGKDDTIYISNRMNQIGNNYCKVLKTGFPCFDQLREIKVDSSNWNFPNENKFRVIWTPRWCTNEGNCNFFSYKDFFIDYCKDNSDIDFIFRPHPQAFTNWIATGELSENEVTKYKNEYANLQNAKIDACKSYNETFATSSCLVTDISSIIPEYFMTGKPIIYCNKKGSLNTFVKDKGYVAGFYWVESQAELKNTLDMLASGNDPLKEKRLELLKTEFYFPKDGSGYLIKEEIKKDFLNA